jgi:hypothetical protein
MENEKKFLLRLPASVVENLKKVNKYNLSLNKQINIIIYNYLKKVLQPSEAEAQKMRDDMGRKKQEDACALSDEALDELIGDL